MLACHARFLFSAALALALAALDPSPFSAAAANSATANAAPLPTATTDLAKEISLVSHRAVYELTLLKSMGSRVQQRRMDALPSISPAPPATATCRISGN